MSTATGLNDSGALIRSAACGSDFTAKHLNAFDDRGLARVRFRHHDFSYPALARRQRRRERPAHRTHAAIERQLPKENVVVENFAEKCPLAAENPQRHRQIERGAFLANIGGREIHGDRMLEWKIEAAVSQRGFDALAAFLHGVVRQADDVEAEFIGLRHVHLNLDEVGVDSKNRGAEGLEEHSGTRLEP